MVNKMVRQKKEWVCSECLGSFIKWAGICPKCGKGGTLKEHILIPTTKKPTATRSQKSLARRAKDSERNIARRMIEADGQDPLYKNVSSSTGRVGHITGMQIDAVSLNYVIENKNRVMPQWINKAWIQILQRAASFNKHALLHMEPSNIAKTFPVDGVKKKTDTMAIITQTRHESLILSEKALFRVREIIESKDSAAQKVKEIQSIFGVVDNPDTLV